jgi:hypothetical protein
MGVKAGAIKTGDASGFLATVLQRMQTERCHRRGIGHVPDAENATLLVQGVVIKSPAGECHR